MTDYTAINPAELPRHNGNFWAAAWEVWYGASEIATVNTEAAIAWYLDTFFSDKAQHIYTTLGEAMGHLMIATILVGQITRKHFQAWVDAEVQSCLPTEAAEKHATEVDPFSPTENQHYPAMAQVITAPAAVAVVKVEAKAKQPTTAELRKMAIEHNRGLSKGDSRYIAGAARLTKAQALKALGMV